MRGGEAKSTIWGIQMGKIKDLVELEGLEEICDVIQVVYLRQLNSLGPAGEGLRRGIKPAHCNGNSVYIFLFWE